MAKEVIVYKHGIRLTVAAFERLFGVGVPPV